MNYRISEIREQMMSKKYALGFHSRSRIKEDGIFNVAEIIAQLGATGTVDVGFNQRGVCWTFEGTFADQDYRLVIGPHQTNHNMVFIITLFKVLPGIEKGQNYRKYAGKTLSYTSEFTYAA
jgi:hypothetical protein